MIYLQFDVRNLEHLSEFSGTYSSSRFRRHWADHDQTQ